MGRKNKLKPDYCEICNEKPPEQVANLSGEYKEDVDDFMWLCISCHRVLDTLIKTNFDSLKVDTFPVTTFFTSSILKQLTKYCNKIGTKRNDIVRQAVYEFLNPINCNCDKDESE